MAKQKKITKYRIELMKLYLTLSGKSEVKGVLEGGNNIADERILITPKGITRWYNSPLEDRAWDWEECDDMDIQCAFFSIDFKVKKFFGFENCYYSCYTYNWQKS